MTLNSYNDDQRTQKWALQERRDLRKEPFVLVCMPIRKSDRLEKFFHETITACFDGVLEVRRIMDIPDDWVRVLRSYIQRASVICFDVTSMDGHVNEHVLRELTYVNDLILDWQANYYLPPLCFYSDLPGASRISWQFAKDVHPTLHGSLSGSKNNLGLTRSVAVLDYAGAADALRADIGTILSMVAQPQMPKLYNAVLQPYKMDHPVLARTLRATGFTPYYLRDEEYDGFDLACTLPVDFQGPAEFFWRRVGRTLPFSSILQRQFADWLSHPQVGLSEARMEYLLSGLLRTTSDAPEIAKCSADVLRVALDTELPHKHRELLLAYTESLNEIVNRAPSMQIRLDSGNPSTVGARPHIAKASPQTLASGMLPLALTDEFLTVVTEERAEFWPSIFGLGRDAVQHYFDRMPAQRRHLHMLGDGLRRMAVATGTVADLVQVAREEFGEAGAEIVGFADPSSPPAAGNGFDPMGRYFAVSEDLKRFGLYQDALDQLGPSLVMITAGMKRHAYTTAQIEGAVRAGILARLIATRSAITEVPLASLVAPCESLAEFLWGESGLEYFEFQSTAQARVNRTAFPWIAVRERVMECIAKTAASKLGVSIEEARIPYKELVFPPAQVWGILIAGRLWDLCDRTLFRDWWAKYAVCEYINKAAPGLLILDVDGVDRWAPVQMA